MHLQITTPTLVVDKQKCLANIGAIAGKAKRNGIKFRPHFKTHQSKTIGRWFMDFGVDSITVSSLRMAEYFALDGWKDITVAFPVNILEMPLINSLAASVTLNLVIESEETLLALAEGLRNPVYLYIKIDAGYNRTGIAHDDHETLQRLFKCIKKYGLNFKGFLSHSGHSYDAKDLESIEAIHNHSKKANIALKEIALSEFEACEISVGDTPTASLIEDFSWADEIRPGNVIFYDLSQWAIGSCTIDQIAVALACPVVAKHANRSELIIYGGGVHFSKDRSILPDGKITCYGLLANWNGNGWHTPNINNYLRSISQEHGILKVDASVFNNTKIGDIALVLPVHSCMTADLLRKYLTTEGNWITD